MTAAADFFRYCHAGFRTRADAPPQASVFPYIKYNPLLSHLSTSLYRRIRHVLFFRQEIVSSAIPKDTIPRSVEADRKFEYAVRHSEPDSG